MVLVSNEEFREMVEMGLLKKGDYAQTMKNHSKSKRHKKYVVEYKYNQYLKNQLKQKQK